MSHELNQLVEAEKKASELFKEIENRDIICAGRTEKEINQSIYDLAFEMFKIKKYWHKRIVRSGPNTLFPYDENPKNLTVEKDDIVFLDFGPIFEEWEADYGRTYVLGNDYLKKKLANDIETAWRKANVFYHSKDVISGCEMYNYCCKLAKYMGWEFGGQIAGHLIGHFPHEKQRK